MNEKEVCVCCGKEVNEVVSKPIDQRDYYVEGCGQLCASCYASIQKK